MEEYSDISGTLSVHNRRLFLGTWATVQVFAYFR
jgi:hypothetical protein